MGGCSRVAGQESSATDRHATLAGHGERVQAPTVASCNHLHVRSHVATAEHEAHRAWLPAPIAANTLKRKPVCHSRAAVAERELLGHQATIPQHTHCGRSSRAKAWVRTWAQRREAASREAV